MHDMRMESKDLDNSESILAGFPGSGQRWWDGKGEGGVARRSIIASFLATAQRWQGERVKVHMRRTLPIPGTEVCQLQCLLTK